MLAFTKAFLAVIFVSFIALGCDKLPFPGMTPKKQERAAAMPASTVAKIGTHYITAEELNREIESYNAIVSQQGMSQNKIDTKEKKLDYLRNELVRKYVLYQEAIDRGLDRDDEVNRELENSKVTLLVSKLVRDELNKIDVSSKEIEDFYNQNKESLRDPEQRRIFEIMTPTEDEAKQVYIELLKGGDFAALAKQSSKAASAANGGDLGLITLEFDPAKRIRSDKFYEVAFSLTQDSNISSIFKGADGFYIIKLESVKKSDVKSLSELWDNIKAWLLFEKQQKTIAELAKKIEGETRVEVFEGKVD